MRCLYEKTYTNYSLVSEAKVYKVENGFYGTVSTSYASQGGTDIGQHQNRLIEHSESRQAVFPTIDEAKAWTEDTAIGRLALMYARRALIRQSCHPFYQKKSPMYNLLILHNYDLLSREAYDWLDRHGYAEIINEQEDINDCWSIRLTESGIKWVESYEKEIAE